MYPRQNTVDKLLDYLGTPIKDWEPDWLRKLAVVFFPIAYPLRWLSLLIVLVFLLPIVIMRDTLFAALKTAWEGPDYKPLRCYTDTYFAWLGDNPDPKYSTIRSVKVVDFIDNKYCTVEFKEPSGAKATATVEPNRLYREYRRGYACDPEFQDYTIKFLAARFNRAG